VTWVCLISFVDIDAKMFKISVSQFFLVAKLHVDFEMCSRQQPTSLKIQRLVL